MPIVIIIVNISKSLPEENGLLYGENFFQVVYMPLFTTNNNNFFLLREKSSFSSLCAALCSLFSLLYVTPAMYVDLSVTKIQQIAFEVEEFSY